MSQIDFIIRNNRDKVSIYNLMPIIVQIIGLSGLLFLFSTKITNEYVLFFYFFLTNFFIFILTLFNIKVLLKNLSFDMYINKSKNDTESIISKISLDHSLALYKPDFNVYILKYSLPISFFTLLKIKKKVTFIVIDNLILVNIRNEDDASFYNLYKDKIEKSIKQSIEQGTSVFSIIENFKVFEPFNLSKN